MQKQQQPQDSLSCFASELLKSIENEHIPVTRKFDERTLADYYYDDYNYDDRNADSFAEISNYDNYFNASKDVSKHRYDSFNAYYDMNKYDNFDLRDDIYDHYEIEKGIRSYSFDGFGSTSSGSGSLSPDSIDLDFSMNSLQLAESKRMRKPPDGYLCHLCFCKGHYIKDCPQVCH